MRGECTMKVLSTPTPCVTRRTVKFCRRPPPVTRITVPSKTWMRSRVPSTTLACTLTVSPARKAGTFSFCCSFSSCWITFMSLPLLISVAVGGGRVPLRRLLLSPLLDAGVVPGQQHLRNPHAAELRRTGELRASGQLTTERVLRQRARVADHPRHQASHRVDHDHGRDLASTEHVIADRDLTGRQACAHPVVDPLVAPAHDDQAR